MEKVDNRIEEALNLRNMKQIELAEKTGLSTKSISAWVTQKYQPKFPAMSQMADALDVSVMWLAGYDCPMERLTEEAELTRIAEFTTLIKNDGRLRRLALNLPLLSDSHLKMVESMVEEFITLSGKHSEDNK